MEIGLLRRRVVSLGRQTEGSLDDGSSAAVRGEGKRDSRSGMELRKSKGRNRETKNGQDGEFFM